METTTPPRNKKTIVFKFLRSVLEAGTLDWPVHRIDVKDLFQMFLQMNPSHLNLFSEIRFFSKQVNSICDDGSLENIFKIEKRNPSYSVAYDFVTKDIINLQPSIGLNEVSSIGK